MEKKFQEPKYYILAIIIGSLIFVSGFLITDFVSYIEYQSVAKDNFKSSYSIFEDKLLISFFGDLDCNEDEKLKKLSEDLAHQGRLISDLETQIGKNDPNVLFQKEFYTLVEIEHLEFLEGYNEKCNKDIPVILFFYSNLGESNANFIGSILDSVYLRNPEVRIYSFDFNLDSVLIEKMKSKYGITEPGSVLVNNNLIVNPVDIDEIEKHL